MKLVMGMSEVLVNLSKLELVWGLVVVYVEVLVGLLILWLVEVLVVE